MKTFSMFVVALALGAAAGMAMDSGMYRSASVSSIAALSNQDSNAAFRDGLYQAKLAIERGDTPHVAIGRWGSNDDRASFRAGYEQGFAQVRGGKHKADNRTFRA
jgi:hypothetical protein